MDRKVILSNQTTPKTASGGHSKVWTPWLEVWCRFEQRSGFKSDAGSQDNLVGNVTITVRYNNNVALYLSKDTRATVGETDYAITDYTIDRRTMFVTIEAVGKKDGVSSATPPDTGYVYVQSGTKEVYHAITPEEVGGTSIILTELIGRTLITIENGRAVPVGIITTGTPNERQMKFTSATGTLEVPETAPWMEGEDLRAIYK